MELLRHILKILTHVAAHPLLLPSFAEAPGTAETLADLLQAYRPEDRTFLPAAALLLTACRAGARAKVGGSRARDWDAVTRHPRPFLTDTHAASHTPQQADLQQPAVQRKLQGSLRLLERKAEVEMKSKPVRVPGKGKQDPSLAAPIRALRRLLEG